MSTRSLPFTVYTKKTQMLLLLLLCAGFAVGGIFMIRDGHKTGWLPAVFFALGIPVFLIQLLPSSSFLTVSDEGIEFRSMFRACKLRWSDISEFGVYTIRHHGLTAHRMVGLNYSSEYQRQSKARAFSKALTGFEGALPDTYGLKADELAKLLSAYHRERTQEANVSEPTN